MFQVLRFSNCGVISLLALFTITAMLVACGGSSGAGASSTNSPAPITPPPITSTIITNGATSANNILYQDGSTSAGGSMSSTNFSLTATLGQSTPAGNSNSAGYALVGGL